MDRYIILDNKAILLFGDEAGTVFTKMRMEIASSQDQFVTKEGVRETPYVIPFKASLEEVEKEPAIVAMETLLIVVKTRNTGGYDVHGKTVRLNVEHIETKDGEYRGVVVISENDFLLWEDLLNEAAIDEVSLRYSLVDLHSFSIESPIITRENENSQEGKE